MGACSIHASVDGHPTRRELLKHLEEWQDQDRAEAEEDDDDDAYTGDWRTIPTIRVIDAVIADAEKAEEVALNKAEKWEWAVAVRTYDADKNPITIVAGWAAS